MSGSKITQLTQTTAPQAYDLVPIVTGSPTTPVTKSVRVDELLDTNVVQFFDYSGSSTIIGWSALSTQRIYVKKIGTTVHVWFHLDGTSGSAGTSFTVPYSTKTLYTVDLVTRIRDNGAAYTTGLAEIFASASKISLYPTLSGGAWTASGSKTVNGYFAYETD